MHLLKEEYARKGIYNGCSVWIQSSVTQDNCSASRDGIFNPHLTTIKNSYITDPLFWIFDHGLPNIKQKAYQPQWLT